MKKTLAPLFVLVLLLWSILHVQKELAHQHFKLVDISKRHTLSTAFILNSPALHLQISNGGAASTPTGKSGNALIVSAGETNVIDSANGKTSSLPVARICVQQYLSFIYPSHNFW